MPRVRSNCFFLSLYSALSHIHSHLSRGVGRKCSNVTESVYQTFLAWKLLQILFFFFFFYTEFYANSFRFGHEHIPQFANVYGILPLGFRSPVFLMIVEQFSVITCIHQNTVWSLNWDANNKIESSTVSKRDGRDKIKHTTHMNRLLFCVCMLTCM